MLVISLLMVFIGISLTLWGWYNSPHVLDYGSGKYGAWRVVLSAVAIGLGLALVLVPIVYLIISVRYVVH